MAGDSGAFATPNSAMQQIYSTNAADPNVAGITPTVTSQGAIFYQDPATGTGTNVWTWSITNQNWVQFSV
jgi:hypothetical protein